MKTVKLKRALLCATLLSGYTALADDKNFFVQVNGGLAVNKVTGLANQDVSDGTSKGSKNVNSALMGLEFGYKVNPNFRLSLSLDYVNQFKTSYYDYSFITLGVGKQEQYGTTSYKIKSLVTMLNLYYDIAEVRNFSPYLTLGLGFARNTAKATLDEMEAFSTVDNSISAQYYPAFATYKSKTTNNFAYKFGAGTRYKFNENFSLDLRYQFADFGKYKTKGTTTADSNGVNESYDPRKGKLKSHQFIVGLSYSF